MGSAFGNGSYGMGWCLPKLDQALSALILDLKDRGMLERTLVVVVGEFCRTLTINAPGTTPGRQYWPSCFSAILAGGGIRSGAVYGESRSIYVSVATVSRVPCRSVNRCSTCLDERRFASSARGMHHACRYRAIWKM